MGRGGSLVASSSEVLGSAVTGVSHFTFPGCLQVYISWARFQPAIPLRSPGLSLPPSCCLLPLHSVVLSHEGELAAYVFMQWSRIKFTQGFSTHCVFAKFSSAPDTSLLELLQGCCFVPLCSTAVSPTRAPLFNGSPGKCPLTSLLLA